MLSKSSNTRPRKKLAIRRGETKDTPLEQVVDENSIAIGDEDNFIEFGDPNEDYIGDDESAHIYDNGHDYGMQVNVDDEVLIPSHPLPHNSRNSNQDDEDTTLASPRIHRGQEEYDNGVEVTNILETLSDVSNHSEYPPSDEFLSCSSSDDDHEDSIENVQFDKDMGDLSKKPPLYIGLEFPSIKAYMWALNQNAIYERFDYVNKKNDGDRVTVQCMKCSWRLHASWDHNSEKFKIKTFQNEHFCTKLDRNSRVTSSWIGERYIDLIKADPNISLESLDALVQQDVQVVVTTSQLYRAKAHARSIIDGELKNQFAKLENYAEVLRTRNPGSIVKIKTIREVPDGPGVFHRFFMGFSAIAKGFWDGCRPFIGLDGCHLRNGTSGCIMSAVSRDGNNQMYLICFALVETENKDSWTWFLEQLTTFLQDFHSHNITFISDRQKGLVEALDKLLPQHEHRFCVRHIYRNLLTAVSVGKGSEMKNLVWETALASTEGKFKVAMEAIKEKNPNAYNYLMKEEPRLWSRHGFTFRSTCDLLTNNTCECFNKWILKAREKNIISMIDHIRRQLMKRLDEKKVNAKLFTNTICPRIWNKIMATRVLAMKYGAHIRAGLYEYEVSFREEKFDVDIKQHLCGCNIWQLSGIPCVHAMVALIDMRLQTPYDFAPYVDKFYHKETYLRAYYGMLHPIPGPTEWPELGREKIQPPKWKKPPGRPRRNRRKGIDEMESSRSAISRVGQVQKCSKCKGIGHKATNCTKETVVKVVTSRGGRPPTHGRYRRERGVSDASSNQDQPQNNRRPRGRPRGARGVGRAQVDNGNSRLSDTRGDGQEFDASTVGSGSHNVGGLHKRDHINTGEGRVCSSVENTSNNVSVSRGALAVERWASLVGAGRVTSVGTAERGQSNGIAGMSGSHVNASGSGTHA